MKTMMGRQLRRVRASAVHSMEAIDIHVVLALLGRASDHITNKLTFFILELSRGTSVDGAARSILILMPVSVVGRRWESNLNPPSADQPRCDHWQTWKPKPRGNHVLFASSHFRRVSQITLTFLTVNHHHLRFPSNLFLSSLITCMYDG